MNERSISVRKQRGEISISFFFAHLFLFIHIKTVVSESITGFSLHSTFLSVVPCSTSIVHINFSRGFFAITVCLK